MRSEKNLPTKNCHLKNQLSLSIPVKMVKLIDKRAELKGRILNIYYLVSRTVKITYRYIKVCMAFLSLLELRS